MLGLTATAGGNAALLAAGNSLFAAWWDGTRWTVSDPLAAGTVRALGFGPAGARGCCSAAGGRRASPDRGARGRRFRPCRQAPRRLAPGPGGSYDALAAAGSKLTVWRLAQGAWAKVQLITVPIQYGSSG